MFPHIEGGSQLLSRLFPRHFSVLTRGASALTPTCPDTSPPLARFLRIPLCPPAMQSTSTHCSLSLKDKMEDACHSSDDLFSKVRVGTLQTIHLFDGLLSKEAVFCFVFFYYVFVIDISAVSCSLKRDVCDICSCRSVCSTCCGPFSLPGDWGTYVLCPDTCV